MASQSQGNWVAMGVLSVLGYFLCTVSAHACVTRFSIGGNVVLKFLLLGGMLGSILTIHAYSMDGFTLPTFAAVTCFGFLCELYIFLFTMIMSSVSAKLLITLSERALTHDDIGEMYNPSDMVTRRLRRLVEADLLSKGSNGWKLTLKGRRLMNLFLWLKRFFGHPLE